MQKEFHWLLQEKYRGVPTPQFRKDLLRLKKGELLDYVIGFTEFLGCKIDLSKKVLIPRQETEFWVGEAIKDIKKNQKKNLKCLDLFAGSGCIGVALLKSCADLLCDIADKDTRALTQIKINCTLNKVSKKRFYIIKSNLFANLKGRYDYIFANPPYIPISKKYKVQKSVLRYEPASALFGGKDGLRYIRRFLGEAKVHLVEGGKIYMEFDPPQKHAIENLVKKQGYRNSNFQKDQFGRWRSVVIE